MNNDIIEKFFSENEPASKTLTAPALAHFIMKTDTDSDFSHKMWESVSKTTFEEQAGREEAALKERRRIESITNASEIIKILRGHTDAFNQSLLLDKALMFEDEIVPEIIRRLKKSFNDKFIEMSGRVLAKSNKDIADELINCFDQIRNPYAQSIVLIVLGFKVDETRAPWIIGKYNMLKKLYPKEDFRDGAYFALVEMQDRFNNS